MTPDIIKPNIADYVNDAGAFIQDGCEFDTAASLVECNILGFCGCGIPDETRMYVEEGLSIIESIADFNRENTDLFSAAYDAFHKAKRERIHARFHSMESWYFFLYWCDAEKLIEHGSSLPGWLTDKGSNLLSLLRQVRSDNNQKEQA